MTEQAAPTYEGISREEIRTFAIVAAISVAAVALKLGGVSPVVVFAVAGVAVAGLAWILGVATEEAGEAAGPRLSALLNATFGNAAEMIIVVLAVHRGLIEVAKASIIGSVLGNLLLILGASLLACGWRFGRKPFNAQVAGMNATMLVLATAALAIPTLFVSVGGTHAREVVDRLSGEVAIVMVILYALYLYASFQTPEDRALSHSSARWSPRLAITMLAITAVATGVLSEILVGAIEPTIEETGISEVFIGLIVIPIIGNVAEHLAAVKIAWGGDLDFSMGIAFNSALQVALAVSALAVVTGFFSPEAVTLAFTPLEIALLIAATVLAGLIAANGTAHWIEGAQLLAIYAIAAFVFWYL